MVRARLLLPCLLVTVASCDKVPIVDIGAGFALADAAWFEEEQTLFFFYRVEAEQGLGPDSQVEVTWRTDDAQLPWTPLAALVPVHTHLPVDCGKTGVCGSFSLAVDSPPRQVGVRLRYHREGQMTLDARVTRNIIGRGPAHSHRSLVVYGVMDQSNTRVQWRARHQFPTLRNEQVQALGLRRRFIVTRPAHGTVGAQQPHNPYGYGFSPACPGGMGPLGWADLETDERAVFDPNELPLAASTSTGVCAQAFVTDATGLFETTAVARKNPQVAPAFPVLRSPIRQSDPLQFVLRPCNRTISEPHFLMQQQRLLMSGVEEICIDHFSQAGFAGQLATTFRARADARRLLGQDMVLVIALHHDDATRGVQDVLEQALEPLLTVERDKSTPRVTGAFVFDSVGYTVTRPGVRALALWCPSNVRPDDLDLEPSTSAQACPLMPDFPDLVLGPFKFSNLPILPTRRQYLTFIAKYSEGQAGRMRALSFRAPERTAFSDNVPVGDFGQITFFNNEVLTAEPSDTFSYCAPFDPWAAPVAFRTELVPEPAPLEVLPQMHQVFPQSSYALGLFWEFPFLLRLDYEVVVAGAVSAYSLSVPFGISNPAQAYWGSQSWMTGEFALHEMLLKCTAFCDHPTFDSGGVYNVAQLFDEVYLNQCYRPRYPVPGDGGFPSDP
jgi:hypothetical protein